MPSRRLSTIALALVLLAGCKNEESPAVDLAVGPELGAPDLSAGDSVVPDRGPAPDQKPTPPPTEWVAASPTTSESLTRLSVVGPTDAWALGTKALLHWDGKVWIKLPMTLSLSDVWASSSSEIWVLASMSAQVLRWSGSDFVQQHTFPLTSAYCLAGSGPGNIWVGSQWNFYATTVYRFDGSKWSGVDTGSQDGVHDIWTLGPTESWFVSLNTLWRWDGQKVSSESQPGIAAVWASGPKDVWIVGKGGLLKRWDGAAWQAHAVTTKDLVGVWGSGPTDLWVVGGVVAHFDGSTWSTLQGSGVPTAGVAISGSSATNVWVIEKSSPPTLYRLRPKS